MLRIPLLIGFSLSASSLELDQECGHYSLVQLRSELVIDRQKTRAGRNAALPDSNEEMRRKWLEEEAEALQRQQTGVDLDAERASLDAERASLPPIPGLPQSRSPKVQKDLPSPYKIMDNVTNQNHTVANVSEEAAETDALVVSDGAAVTSALHWGSPRTCKVTDDTFFSVFDGEKKPLSQFVKADIDTDTDTDTDSGFRLKDFLKDGEAKDMWLVRGRAHDGTTVRIAARYWRNSTATGHQIFLKSLAVSGGFITNRTLVVRPLQDGITWNDKKKTYGILKNEESAFNIEGLVNATRRSNSDGSGSTVEVMFPKEVKLVFTMHQKYLNVALSMPPLAIQDGLCGNFNGDSSDDTLGKILSRGPRLNDEHSLLPPEWVPPKAQDMYPEEHQDLNAKHEQTNSTGLVTQHAPLAEMSRFSDKVINSDADCDWDNSTNKCASADFCQYQYHVGDVTLGQSCRRKEKVISSDEDCHWDYGAVKCADLDRCHYLFVFGDLNLDQSCRMRPKPAATGVTSTSSTEDEVQRMRHYLAPEEAEPPAAVAPSAPVNQAPASDQVDALAEEQLNSPTDAYAREERRAENAADRQAHHDEKAAEHQANADAREEARDERDKEKGQPRSSQPRAEAAAIKQATPAAEQPAVEAPSAEEAAVSAPAAEESVVEAPAAEEPAVEDGSLARQPTDCPAAWLVQEDIPLNFVSRWGGGQKLKFAGSGKVSGVGYDVIVSASAGGNFVPNNGQLTDGGLASINFPMRQKSSVIFKFFRSGTNQQEAVAPPGFSLTLYDVDSSLYGPEIVTIFGASAYAPGAGHEAYYNVEEGDGKLTLVSLQRGWAPDNPSGTGGLTADQISKSITLAFEGASSFELEIDLSGMDNQDGRNILFSFIHEIVPSTECKDAVPDCDDDECSDATPTPTAAPTADPTAAPTSAPTADPTADPTLAPTADPTAEPTEITTLPPKATTTAGGEEKSVSTTTTTTEDCSDPSSCIIWGDPHIISFDVNRKRRREHPQLEAFFRTRDWKNDELTVQGEGLYWLIDSEQVKIQARYKANVSNPEFTSLAALAISGPFINDNLLQIHTLDHHVMWNQKVILESIGTSFSNKFVHASFTHDSELVANGYKGAGVDIQLPHGLSLTVNRWSKSLAVKINMCRSLAQQDGQCGNNNGDPHDDSGLLSKRNGEQLTKDKSLFPSEKKAAKANTSWTTSWHEWVNNNSAAEKPQEAPPVTSEDKQASQTSPGANMDESATYTAEESAQIKELVDKIKEVTEEKQTVAEEVNTMDTATITEQEKREVEMDEVSYTMIGTGFCTPDEKFDGSRIGDWVSGGSKRVAEIGCEQHPDCQGFHWNVLDEAYVLVNKVGPELGPNTEKGEECYQKPASQLPVLTKTADVDDECSYVVFGNGFCTPSEKENGSRIGDWVYGRNKHHAQKACEKQSGCMGFHWNQFDSSYVLVSQVGPELGDNSHKGEICFQKPGGVSGEKEGKAVKPRIFAATEMAVP